MDTNNDRPTLQISGGLAASGDDVVHSTYGIVRLMHSEENSWHYLRLGEAGFGKDFEKLRVGQDPDQIVLSGPLVIDEKDGLQIHVKEIAIDARGYIPDVWVWLDWEKSIQQSPDIDIDAPNRMSLFDDDIFLSGVLKRLRELGYEGKDFGRAELGAQGRDVVCMEPNHDFDAFAMKKGWKYAGGMEEYTAEELLREINGQSKLTFQGEGTTFSMNLSQLVHVHGQLHQGRHGGRLDTILREISIPLFKETPELALDWVKGDDNWPHVERLVKVDERVMPDPKAALQADAHARIDWNCGKKAPRP